VAADLFVWLDALWTKARLEGTPPLYVIHRFLASERDYAPAARILARDVKEPALVFCTWQGLLPVDRGAPRLSYPAPKKPPEAEALTVRMMAVYGMNRLEAEDAQSFVAAAGRPLDLYRELGVEPPETVIEMALDEDADAPRRGRRKGVAPPATGGLLGTIA
jgi:hypothetical protein